MKFKDITGQNFHKLYVLEYAGSDKWRNSLWWCLCDCGEVTKVIGGCLKSGNTKSCGCISVGMRNKRRKPGNSKNTSGQNLHIPNKASKNKAIEEIKKQACLYDYDKLGDRTIGRKMYFNILKRTINDIGLQSKQRKGRDTYDTIYYFKQGHKRYGMLEEICEALGLHPEYVIRVLNDNGVLPIPAGYFN